MATKHTNKVGTFYDGKKAVDLWGDDLTGWTVHSGDNPSTEADYYKFIPTMYRGTGLRAGSVSTMPFEIRKGKRIYDTSAEWENKVGFMPNPTRLLYLIEAALTLAGKAYVFRERNVAVTKELKYHLPSSVRPEISKDKSEVEYFIRKVDMVDKRFKVEDYIYFWPPDPYVEIGPAENFPALAAVHACGVLVNMDLFAEGFFERGAIKAMLLTVKGMPVPAEREKLENWWRRVVGGIKNAFGAKVINAEAITPVVVGEGMKELENVTVGQEKREDISIALGIPMSILFANAANYATSQQDELNFLNKTIIPECEFIASVLNEQLFDALGLRFVFLPETLDAMQEDENERAAAMNTFMDAVIKAETLEMAQALFMIYGVEVPDEAMALIETYYAEKKKAAEDAEKRNAEQLEKLREQQSQPPELEQEEEEEEEEPLPPPTKAYVMEKSPPFVLSVEALRDLEIWRRKALKAIAKGEKVTFTNIDAIIPENVYTTISAALDMAKSTDDVHRIFTDITTVLDFSEPTRTDDTALVANLLEGIKMGVEALKVTE